MSDIPEYIILQKDNEYTYKNDATTVDNILKEIDALKGRALSKNTVVEFEFRLQELLDYVTVIGFDILEKQAYLENHNLGRVLAYFYDEDMIKLLGLYLLADNCYQHHKNITNYLDEIKCYKNDCIVNNRCLVYEIDDTDENIAFKLNPYISDLSRL